MEYKKLKAEVKEIAEIAAAVPEEFRAKCFEILLNNLVGAAQPQSSPAKSGTADTPDAVEPDAPGVSVAPISLPSKVRMWLRKTKTSPEQLASVLVVEDGEVHFLVEPDPKNSAEGLQQWGLIQALRTALLGGDLVIDPESVRSLCQEKGCYDRSNFAANLSRKLDQFVTGDLESQGEQRRLNAAGEKELGALVQKLADSA